MEKYLIVIVGPTASGKTGLGIELSQIFNAPILSADSRQFYREISIGTAKPTDEELSQAPHYFIDNLSVHDEYSVGDYEKESIELLNRIYEEKNIAILLGGSGLFVNAVLFGLDEFPDVPNSIREKYKEMELKKGIHVLQKELEQKDPEYYSKVDIRNPHRLIRALSVIEVSGRPYSSFLNRPKKKRNFKPIIIYLAWDREQLYDRINRRVDMMMEAGHLAEVESVFYLRDLNALQTVGYQELFDYLEGATDLGTALELMKRNTRRYAKRQMTWFRKMENKASFHPDSKKGIIQYINEQMN